MELNFQAYKTLYSIENRIRKILIDFLDCGIILNASNLFDLNIPENAKNRIIDFVRLNLVSKNSKLSEDEAILLKLYKELFRSNQTVVKLYSPIFYLTTLELYGLFKRDVVQLALKRNFGNDNSKMFYVFFENILLVRNDIAHNRNISKEEFNSLSIFLHFIENNLGLNTPLDTFNQFEDLASMLQELKDNYTELKIEKLLSKNQIVNLQASLKKIQSSVWTSLFFSGIGPSIDDTYFKTEEYFKYLQTTGGSLFLNSLHPQLLKQVSEIISFYE